ncbi:MAG TPA: enoyl-CoA hydratase/isomerase family protein [Desulfobacteraceae bacterium]|nr:enoyl-CoA hydratase/isomerase family protein [Desulfobacteraceae bacterium]HPJ66823.1 enoyl-CoA hydratase/isomerase family protein [Desulfobacteraceae bacterium]HPQ27033.1 enoyl-CoA hydratase/isomerase family protein [Desulfobacteraceae bacterium]
MMNEEIRFKKEDKIAWIKMNRPSKLNALTSAMLDSFQQAILKANLDDDIRVIAIVGSERAFCAGADIEEEQTMDASDALAFSIRGQNLCQALQLSMKPVVAVIDGYALGGGLEMALACDFRISSKDGLFGFPEVTLGVTTGWGGATNLVKMIGPSKAKELLMLGKIISAEEAYQLGIISELVPADQLIAAASELAEKLSSLPASSLAMVKNLVNKYSESFSPKEQFLEAVANAYCYSLEEKAKAYEAFMGRKKK